MSPAEALGTLGLMWRMFGGAALVVAGIAAFIEAGSHQPIRSVPPKVRSYRVHNYATLVTKEIPGGEVASVEFRNKDKALEVRFKNGETWEAGFNHQSAPELAKQLRSYGIPYEVESEPAALSRTAYDLLRIGGWALVIFGAVLLIVGLIGYWGAQRRGPASSA